MTHIGRLTKDRRQVLGKNPWSYPDILRGMSRVLNQRNGHVLKLARENVGVMSVLFEEYLSHLTKPETLESTNTSCRVYMLLQQRLSAGKTERTGVWDKQVVCERFVDSPRGNSSSLSSIRDHKTFERRAESAYLEWKPNYLTPNGRARWMKGKGIG